MADLKKAIEDFEEGRLNDAEKQLKSLMSEQVENPDIYYYLGQIAFQKDQFDAAIDYAEKAIGLNERQAAYHELLGQALGLKAQQAGAIKGAMLLRKVKSAFQTALELDPKSLRAREGLFMIFLFTPPIAGGDINKAMELLEKIKTQNRAHGHLAQAMIHLKNNELKAAEQEFEKAIETDDHDREILMRTGRFFLQGKNVHKARQIADLYIKNFPEDPRGYLLLGEAYLDDEQLEQALEWINLAIEKDELFFNAHLQRIKAMLKNGRKAEAQKDADFVLNHPEAGESVKNQVKKMIQ